jgi:polysaccharide export outer membrane protein
MSNLSHLTKTLFSTFFRKHLAVYPIGGALFLLSLNACVSPKDLVYMQESGVTTDTIIEYQNLHGVYRLQTDDVLSISIKSLNQENANLFNLGNQSNVVNVSPAFNFISGYSVDPEGNIRLPVIGKVQVADLTIEELQTKLQAQVEIYLNDATVLVNMVSYKVSVLGEVAKPGQFYIYNNRVNIFEAISRAGDLQDFANRKRVILVRQTREGSQSTTIDLTDSNLISSPFYYLRPNDVLYIEPLNQKSARLNLENLRFVTAFFTGITTFATVYALLRRENP